MKVHNMKQGSRAWHEARLGIPTTSCFSRLITQKTLKPSAARFGYLHELLAERLTGEKEEISENGFMIRGGKLEQQAANRYEFERDVDTEVVGFCTTDDGMIGCSPDRFVGDDGLLEIKCPSAKVFVGMMLDGVGHAHRCQVQGQMWLTGRQWCDLLIYNPITSPIIQRFEPEPEWVEAFEPVVFEFVERLKEGHEKIAALTGDLENS